MKTHKKNSESSHFCVRSTTVTTMKQSSQWEKLLYGEKEHTVENALRRHVYWRWIMCVIEALTMMKQSFKWEKSEKHGEIARKRTYHWERTEKTMNREESVGGQSPPTCCAFVLGYSGGVWGAVPLQHVAPLFWVTRGGGLGGVVPPQHVAPLF